MDGKVVISCDMDTSPFDAQIDYVKGQMETIEDKLKQADLGYEVGDVQKLEAQYERLGLQLDKLNQKKSDFIAKSNISAGFEGLKGTLKGIGEGMEKNMKKVKKWALAIFGIRSAYALIRNSIGVISQGDEQLKADIDYMKNAVAYVLEPVIRGIVNLAKQLMLYIGYIIQQWTGKNIFENANKSLKKANKQAKELKKQLAGFDEANVLSDNSSSGGGSTMPSFDLSKGLGEGEVPEWLKWIVDNKDTILAVLAGIGTAIVLIKLGVSGIIALGIGVAIAGVVKAITGLIDYLKDPTWENFGKILQGLGLLILGIGIAFGSVPAMIVGAVVLILGTLAKFWDKITKWIDDFLKDVYKAGDIIMNWIAEKTGVFGVFLNTLIGTAIGIFTSLVEFVKNLLDGLFKGVRLILDGIIDIFKGNFKEGIIKIGKGIANILIGVLNALISAVNLIVSPIRALIVAVGKVMGKSWTMDNIKIPKIPLLATGAIVNNPGKGVMMGNYIAGERGREGIIPLTDPNAMSQLGQEIARYVNISNVVDVNMDSRRINRIMQQSRNNSDFARNV